MPKKKRLPKKLEFSMNIDWEIIMTWNLPAWGFHAILLTFYQTIFPDSEDDTEMFYMNRSEGNRLSSSISGFVTRETKTGDSEPKCEPEETMKVFGDAAEQKERRADSRSDVCEWEIRVTEGQTNLVNLVGLQYCQHPWPVERLWSKLILLHTLWFACLYVCVSANARQIL